MPPETVRKVMRDELGPDWRDRFSRVQRSSGSSSVDRQVHKAVAAMAASWQSRCSTPAPGKL